MMIIMEHLPSHQILFSSFVAHRPEELTFTSYPRWAGAVPRVYLDGVRWYSSPFSQRGFGGREATRLESGRAGFEAKSIEL